MWLLREQIFAKCPAGPDRVNPDAREGISMAYGRGRGQEICEGGSGICGLVRAAKVRVIGITVNEVIMVAFAPGAGHQRRDVRDRRYQFWKGKSFYHCLFSRYQAASNRQDCRGRPRHSRDLSRTKGIAYWRDAS